MKKLFYLFLLLYITPLAQEKPQAAFELVIHVRNNVDLNLIEATLVLVSECWDAHLADVNDHDITSAYPGTTVSTRLNLGYIGWNVPWRASSDKFGLGKYLVSVYYRDINNREFYDEFYIDYRTSDLPEAWDSRDDIVVYLNTNNGILYWNSNLTNQVGTDYTIWGLSASKGTNITLKTTELEPYVPQNISVTQTGNPQLSWNHSTENDYVTSYAIYRGTSPDGLNPPPINQFTRVGTVGATTTSWTDMQISGTRGLMFFYYIAAVNGNRKSEPSDLVSRRGYFLEKQSLSNDNQIKKLILYQNYPNPFNPNTKIKFAVPGLAGIKYSISLQVYDILGNLIKTILKEEKETDIYEVEFDGRELAGGMYFYRLQTENYTETKKLILLK